MKKCLVLGGVLFLLCAVAYTAGQQDEKAQGGKIVLYTPAWGVEFAQNIIAEYQKVNPSVTVELMEGPSSWNEHVARTSLWMRTRFPSVDLIYVDDSGTVDGIALGYWEKLDDLLPREAIDNLVGLQKDYMTAHGGLYRVPWWNGMGYLFYRKDLFEEAGVSVPETWDELLEVSRILTKDLNDDGTIDQWGYLSQGEPGPMFNNYIEFLMQAGGDPLKLAVQGKAEEEALAALEFMKQLYNETAPSDMVAIDYNQSRAMFMQGKAAILRDWANTGRLAVSEGMADKVGVMEFPSGPAGSWGLGHSWGIAVNKYGENYKKTPEAVTEFLHFMTRDEIHAISAKAEGPALSSILNDPEMMKEIISDNIVISDFADFINNRKVRTFPPGNSSEYMDIIGKHVSAYIFNREASDDQAEDVLREIQESIDPLFE